MLSQDVRDDTSSLKEISHPSNDETGACSAPTTEIEWIKCRGCKGEIGVPSALRERQIECPGCGLVHKLSETILFRPPAPAVTAPAPPPLAPTRQPEPQNQPAMASVALLRNADVTLNWGIASIVLGWTILVPLIGFIYYSAVADEAKKENTLVPGKATIGLVLSLLFGVAQGAAMIAHANR